MKRFFTWVLALGLLAVAALYLASVLWPPPGEGGPGEGAYPLLARPGVVDPSKQDPAAATPFDELSDVLRNTDPDAASVPAHLQPRLRIKVANQSGEALANSNLRLFLAGGGGKVAREGRTDAQGELLLLDIQPGSYLIEASAKGYFSAASRTVSVPTGREEPEVLTLSAGATMLAHLQDEFGRKRVDGVVLLQNASGNQRYLLRANGDGEAHSEALPGGAWSISWREHQYAEELPNLATTLAAVPGDRVEFWITLPAAAAAKPPAENAPRYAVGVSLTAPQSL